MGQLHCHLLLSLPCTQTERLPNGFGSFQWGNKRDERPITKNAEQKAERLWLCESIAEQMD